MEKTIYQIQYSKGSYDSFVSWCSDELYESKELAQKEMEKFKEENSKENLWKKMKLSKKEDWGDVFGVPLIYSCRTVPDGIDMSHDEFNKACGDDISFFYEYLCEDEGYNYDQFEVIERKLIISDL